MGVSQVFEIVQIVLNREKHHIFSLEKFIWQST